MSWQLSHRRLSFSNGFGSYLRSIYCTDSLNADTCRDLQGASFLDSTGNHKALTRQNGKVRKLEQENQPSHEARLVARSTNISETLPCKVQVVGNPAKAAR